MSTYAFRSVTGFSQILKSHEARGFRVLVSGVHWEPVKALAKKVGLQTNKSDTLVLSSLARRLHEGDKAGQPFFGQPTLIVLDDSESPELESTAWQRIQAAAADSDSQGIFAYASQDAMLKG